jgi:hypothetical protein
LPDEKLENFAKDLNEQAHGKSIGISKNDLLMASINVFK